MTWCLGMRAYHYLRSCSPEVSAEVRGLRPFWENPRPSQAAPADSFGAPRLLADFVHESGHERDPSLGRLSTPHRDRAAYSSMSALSSFLPAASSAALWASFRASPFSAWSLIPFACSVPGIAPVAAAPASSLALPAIEATETAASAAAAPAMNPACTSDA